MEIINCQIHYAQLFQEVLVSEGFVRGFIRNVRSGPVSRVLVVVILSLLSVYSVFSQQNAPAASYTDTINVSVSY